MRRVVSARRSAAEWKRIVTDWRRSGLTAEDFAASRGLVVGTLKVWSWRIGKQAAPRRRREKALRLIPVQIAEEGPQSSAALGQVTWELTSAGGYVLRVQDGLELDQLERILRAMSA